MRLAVAVRRRPAMRGPATRLPREEGVCRECVTVRVMLRMGKLTSVFVLFARGGSRRVSAALRWRGRGVGITASRPRHRHAIDAAASRGRCRREWNHGVAAATITKELTAKIDKAMLPDFLGPTQEEIDSYGPSL